MLLLRLLLLLLQSLLTHQILTQQNPAAQEAFSSERPSAGDRYTVRLGFTWMTSQTELKMKTRMRRKLLLKS